MGFEGKLSEESQKALQSETWQKVRDGMKEKMEENDADGLDAPVVERTEENPNAGETLPAEQAEEDEAGGTPALIGADSEGCSEVPSPETAEGRAADAQDGGSAGRLAEEKLKREMKAAKDKSFAEPIIGYLLERCREDEGMAQDVAQEHKTWKKCFDYIYEQARRQAEGNRAAVRDEVVYEWAEDYYHKDDKAEEEKKAKKTAEDKTKKAIPAMERKTAGTKSGAKKEEKMPVVQKAEVPNESLKPKKNRKDMDGQLDMFAMMGI